MLILKTIKQEFDAKNLTIEETKLIYDISRFGSSKGDFVNEA